MRAVGGAITTTARETLRRADRLRSPKDFRRVSRSGRRRSSPNFVVLATQGRDPDRVRLGMAVSRKVGNAVRRNRLKRQIRSWFREHRDQLPAASDLVVIVRPGAAHLASGDLRHELTELFE